MIEAKKYYIELDFLTSGDGHLSKIVSVSKEIYDKLYPFSDELENGSVGSLDEEIQNLLGEIYELKKARKIDEAGGSFIYVAYC